ncbi:MAG: trimethylamine methyltransferase family protein [Proteobacteria bacterium]|nr:trimethylamine methyltransferase family protein [Pseudomonadota bacterium]
MRSDRVQTSSELLGSDTVRMLLRSHQDAVWILENLGVGCRQPDMIKAFRAFEADGLAVVYDGRIYLTRDLINQALSRAPGLDDFFVPLNSYFIGGTAPYIYDDERGQGGVMPTTAHAARIADLAAELPAVSGMGRGIKLKGEVEQMTIMDEHCPKPLYVAVTSERSLAKAVELWERRGNVMIVFCLTRPPVQVNENFSETFVQVVRAGLPVFISAMPMGGISAPFCYNGILAMTHAEVMFGITAAQLINPGVTVIHGGYPTIADPRIEYNPHYGLKSHQLLNILMAHLNLMLDLPSIQSAGTTHEEHPTPKAYADARLGQALCKKYGVHMIRHPFAFLRYLIDFSIAKLEKAATEFLEVKPEDAPEVEMPVYDERGLESLQKIGLASYMDDPLTTANLGRVFVD